jgi:uncharacterized protein YbjQ (UPF0145 family)
MPPPPPPLRRWTCPGCHNQYKLPTAAPDPDLCPECVKRHTIKKPVQAAIDAKPFKSIGEQVGEKLAERAAEKRRQKEINAEEERAIRAIQLTTLPAPICRRVVKELGIVASQVLLHISEFRAGFSKATSAFSGRVRELEGRFQDSRREALYELRCHAFDRGADFVLGVHVGYSEFGGGDGLMMLITATGTAVRTEPILDAPEVIPDPA